MCFAFLRPKESKPKTEVCKPKTEESEFSVDRAELFHLLFQNDNRLLFGKVFLFNIVFFFNIFSGYFFVLIGSEKMSLVTFVCLV
jgi:hypothetical protein